MPATKTKTDYVTMTGTVLRRNVLPSLTRDLAAPGTVPPVAGRARLVAHVIAWADDLGAGRDEAALAPAPFALALETIWLLAIVDIVPDAASDGRFVDFLLRPDLVRALDLAVAAADVLDLLRGSGVGAAYRARRMRLVETMATVAAGPIAGVAGTA